MIVGGVGGVPPLMPATELEDSVPAQLPPWEITPVIIVIWNMSPGAEHRELVSNLGAARPVADEETTTV